MNINEIKNKNINEISENEIIYLIEMAEKSLTKLALSEIKFPKTYEVNLGLEEDNVEYIVCENSEEIDIFDQPSNICEYILFMVKDDTFIAVDGGTKRSTWIIPENN